MGFTAPGREKEIAANSLIVTLWPPPMKYYIWSAVVDINNQYDIDMPTAHCSLPSSELIAGYTYVEQSIYCQPSYQISFILQRKAVTDS